METRLSQIENATLHGYLHYRPADKRADEKAGRKDGEQNKPQADATEYPFRNTVLTEARAALHAYNDKVEAERTQLHHHRATLQQDIDERYKIQRESIQSSYGRELERLEQTLGPNSTKRSTLSKQLQEAQERARHLETDLGRPLRIHLRYVYAFIMAGVALIEIPINRFAFELFFAERPALTLLIALGIGCALMLLAHFTGTWLKRMTGAPGIGQKAMYGGGVVVALALILPTIVFIALLRQHYVHFIEAQQVTFGELLRQHDIADVAQNVMKTELGTAGWMLLMINVLVVGIGIVASVMRHDTHPDYENIVAVREKTEKKLNRIKTAYDKKVNRLKKHFDDQLASLEKHVDRTERDIETIDAGLRRIQDHRERMIDRVALAVKQRLNSYETGNSRARMADEPPFFWSADEDKLKKELKTAFAGEEPKRHAAASDIRAVN